MGLDLTFQASGNTLARRLSMADWATVEAIKTHLPLEVAACFEVPELGQAVAIKTIDLRTSAAKIALFLSENAALLPATYQYKMERYPVPGIPADDLMFQTGGIGGLRLPNDPDHFYSLKAGLDECKLEMMAVGADGSGTVVGSRDLRGELELQTETVGLIKFRRRAAKTTLRRIVQEIERFADSVTGHVVRKTIG